MLPNVIAISYAKRALEPGTRERARLRSYAEALGVYHVIVFTDHTEGFPAVQQDGPLTLYATNARSKVGKLARAFAIGKQIMAAAPNTSFVISCQDPFETCVVGSLLAERGRHTLQIQVHGDVFNSYSYKESLLQRLRVWYGKRAVRRATMIRVVSERVKHSVTQLGVPAERTTVLPIQADMSVFLAAGAARLAAEPPQDTPLRLLYVGRLAPEKNLSLLLRACAAARSHGLQCTLELVGDGPERLRLKALVNELSLTDCVTFTAWTDDIPAVMAHADVFCLTSDHEGWGMVLVEAAAAGLAVVTTDVGAAGEFIQHERTGLVVPVRDEESLVSALLRLQDDTLRTALATAAHSAAQHWQQTDTAYLQAWVATHRPPS